MKIKNVCLDWHSDDGDLLAGRKYDLSSSYLTLFISSWIRSKNIDLERFNRIVFEEGGGNEEMIETKALVIGLKNDFIPFDESASQETVHRYFLGKILEGFTKFDEEYKYNLAEPLLNAINDYFESSFTYTSKLKSKVILGRHLSVLSVYAYNYFKLIVRLEEKQNGKMSEFVIYEGEPDPYIISLDIKTINISEEGVVVLDGDGNIFAEKALTERKK